jgi:sugar phosphate permease
VAFFLPPMQTVMQRATPVEAHGRVLGLASTLEAWGSLIAIPLTGLVVASIGVSRTGMAVGAVAVAAGLAGLVRIRRTPVPVSQPSAV